MYRPQLPLQSSLGYIYHQAYRQIHAERPKLEMICKIYSDCQLVYRYRL